MFNQYPYLNLNDLNLDYILKAIREMKYEVTNFVSINAIKYADPIQWNITSQYEKNTIVIDPVTGTAYISVAAVPSGVALTRPEYWTVVFDLGSFVTRAAQNFTSRWESETTTTATFPTNTGEWLVWGDVLYKAISNIIAGDTYVVGSNIEHFTIEDLYNAYLNTIAQILAMIGDLDALETTDKSDLVNAINSLVGSVVFYAPTVAVMIASDYPLNATVITQGYHTILDNGGAVFRISDTPDNSTYHITLDSGLYANLIYTNYITTAQMGYVNGDDITDLIGSPFNIVLSHDYILRAEPYGVYNIDNIEFNGHTLTQSADPVVYSTAVEITKSKSHFNLEELNLMVHGDNIIVSNFKINKSENSGFLVTVEDSNNIVISDFVLTAVYDPVNSITNGDGIHVRKGGTNITICNGYFDTGDDCISLCADDYRYSDQQYFPDLAGDIENVTIDNVICADTCFSGVKLFNEFHTIKNVTISNSILTGAHSGCFKNLFAVPADATGITEDIHISNCTFKLLGDVMTESAERKLILDNAGRDLKITNCSFILKNNVQLPIWIVNKTALIIDGITVKAENRGNILSDWDVLRVDDSGVSIIKNMIVENLSGQRVRPLYFNGDHDYINVDTLFNDNTNSYLIYVKNCSRMDVKSIRSTNSYTGSGIQTAGTVTSLKNYDEGYYYDDILTYDAGTNLFVGTKPFPLSFGYVVTFRIGAGGHLVQAWYKTNSQAFEPFDNTNLTNGMQGRVIVVV